MSLGELQIPLQLFTSLVNNSTPGDVVGGGFYKSESPNFVLSDADNALRLRRLKLHGENVPKTASLRHCEKIVLLGGT